VLVHCQKGISRSSAIVFAYLMYASRFLLPHLHVSRHVKLRHSCKPNSGFLEQLRRYHEQQGSSERSVGSIKHSGSRRSSVQKEEEAVTL
jgi:dual specificity phosphatase 12